MPLRQATEGDFRIAHTLSHEPHTSLEEPMKRLFTALVLDLTVACQGAAPPSLSDASTGGLWSNQDTGSAAGECVSGEWWNDGDRGSTKMHPGSDCNACHQEVREGPIYAIAGTVYNQWEEPTDCNGPSDVEVLLVDSSGRQVSAWTNQAGNFTLRGSDFNPSWPVQAAVVVAGEERWMDATIAESDGSCNRCHTAEGLVGAPGRVVLP
jgi:hypothetical protein